MKRLLIPGLTTLIVVVSWVAFAGWNRSSAPRLTITLTERELSLPWTSADADNHSPGMQLRFEYERRDDPLDARNWLTEDRLRALGFVFAVPVSAPEAELTYGRALPRIGWVVFEYGGPAWQDIDRRRKLPSELERSRQAMDPSRLVPIDAGPDLDALLSRYPSGHLIIRASLGLNYLRPDQAHGPSRGPLAYGVIRRLHPASVTVPVHLRDRLAGLNRKERIRPPQPPRYEVDLAVGRLGVPYIRDIRRRELIADPQ